VKDSITWTVGSEHASGVEGTASPPPPQGKRIVGDELEDEQVDGEGHREPGVGLAKELEPAHERGLVFSGS
jgi:hypothetical protein